MISVVITTYVQELLWFRMSTEEVPFVTSMRQTHVKLRHCSTDSCRVARSIQIGNQGNVLTVTRRRNVLLGSTGISSGESTKGGHSPYNAAAGR
jgi:hypothetical protein